MTNADVTRSAATYAIVWVLSVVVGSSIAGYGVLNWVLPAYLEYGGGAPAIVAIRSAAPGLAVAAFGLLGWKVTSSIVLYRTLSTAYAAETADRLNTEAMKSDILSVMDERLADMKQDTQRTRRIVERESSGEAADEFEFPR